MVLVEKLPAEAYLDRREIAYDIEFHRVSESALAEAKELALPAEIVLKAILLKVNGRLALAVIPASQRLSVRDVRLISGDKGARLATEAEIELAFPEHELGALPPLPGLLGVPGFVDAGILGYEVVAFADGRRTESMIASPRRLFWGEDVIVGSIAAGDGLSFDGEWRD